ncbi:MULTISPECIES: stage III sporulation protein SpoIIIAB [Pontibacillus]|uniref:Stage III sporulation protein SpoIIIAB n=1 Tax=Pontibacillus chungwhensis TaxID=265426 RepID=A0ABY8UZ16_9BACI|nr:MULTISPECIES: stage III sporulation protein SpoIIIAB [Pontibacillus]MCD5323526.1 stage III sporulation protein SpoAB [Pontibacillus sp. HN14]WIF96896.1 stage III sporulation protein SpoIIIAB [Pontibacillus chungwhensis]
MKWIGALILLCATTWGGFEFARRLTERPKQIRQLKNALQVLEAEILYGHSPVIEACEKVARQIPEPMAWFFYEFSDQLKESSASLYDVWEQRIQSFWPLSALGEGEKEIMKQFGQTLGQHDFTGQQKHIRLAISHLERELKEAEEQQQKYSKMVKSLGFLTGLLIILLFM